MMTRRGLFALFSAAMARFGMARPALTGARCVTFARVALKTAGAKLQQPYKTGARDMTLGVKGRRGYVYYRYADLSGSGRRVEFVMAPTLVLHSEAETLARSEGVFAEAQRRFPGGVVYEITGNELETRVMLFLPNSSLLSEPQRC